MTRTISVLLAQSTAATLLLGCGFFAMAQDAIRDKVRVDVNAGQRDRDDRRDVIRLSTILKSKVLIQQNQPAGNVVDVVLSDGGCVEYIVASNRDQYYVVPYSAAQVRYADQVVFVDMAPAQFQNVAYFSANSWPNLYAPAYRNQVYAFYGLNVPRAGVNVNINGNLPINNRNRANNDLKADSATPETRKTLKPELPNTPTTPELNKPNARGDLPVSPQPKEVIPPAADKKPVVPPTPNLIPRDPKEVPKPKLPL